ncbi:TonB family protein [Parasphingorhabdus sp.]|uniref:energy transducer TonB n=1 Tax=Parasphingorhabdus sp. TaxID=2709688 RepID=UPI0039E35803
MSYVSVYENKTPRSKGLILTGVVHAAIIAAVIAMPAIVGPGKKWNGPFIADHIPLPTPPEPVIEDLKREVKAAPQTRQTAPDRPIIKLPPAPADEYTEIRLGNGSEGTGIEVPIEPIRIAPEPVIVGARLNARYAGQFQPDYPVGQLRREQEGEVSVRVLVGIDGRVKQIELIDSPHSDFWSATRKQALSKWRFTPATKDGKPFESWMTLKVRFEINS